MALVYGARLNDPHWQAETLGHISDLLRGRDDVISLSVFGSLADPDIVKDQWSDLDVLIIVRDGSLATFYTSMVWLAVLGDEFTSQHTVDATQVTVKVIFTDFRKLDIVILEEAGISAALVWPRKQQVLFCHSQKVAGQLQQQPSPLPFDESEADFAGLVSRYWYLSFVSVTKLMRNDLVIGLHLALELYRECLVLAMMLRDRHEETTVHRTGGVMNDLVEQMSVHLPAPSSEHILTFIDDCGAAFDRLASQYDPEYRERSSLFQRVLAAARADLLSQR